MKSELKLLENTSTIKHGNGSSTEQVGWPRQEAIE
jgi:hypothetical protein